MPPADPVAPIPAGRSLIAGHVSIVPVCRLLGAHRGFPREQGQWPALPCARRPCPQRSSRPQAPLV